MPSLKASILQRVLEAANKLSYEGTKLAPKERALLFDYLKGDGKDPLIADLLPGSMPTKMGVPFTKEQLQQIAVKPPTPDELWYRGGPAHLKLQDPVFTTRQPGGAAWFAVERGNNGIGAVGEYTTTAKRQARQADMFRVGLENNLDDVMAEHQNLWDWTYDPAFRDALKSSGYDSALGYDALENGDIEALVGLSSDIFTPKARSIVTYDDHPIWEQTGKVPRQFGGNENYYQFGETKPWSRKAVGGLVQYRDCGCK